MLIREIEKLARDNNARAVYQQIVELYPARLDNATNNAQWKKLVKTLQWILDQR